jgi:predicted anti-sigma-YlaC factor YlaD
MSRPDEPRVREDAEELDCQAVVELVTDYLEGVLDADAVARVESHLAICEGCETYFEQIRRTIAATGSVTWQSLPPATVDALVAAFRDVRRPPAP